MPALTTTDVADLLKKLNAELQPPGVCAATPAKMKLLLERLSDYTDEVQFARNKYKALGIASIAIGPGAVAISELLGGGDVDVAQWRTDMTNWQFRLAEYQRALDAVPEDMMDTAEGCKLIYPTVTAPLMDGIWYQIMPGVSLNEDEKNRIRTGQGHCAPTDPLCIDVPGDHPGGHSNPSPPDVITPFSLGNQIIVYQDFQKENLRRLIDELVEGFKKVGQPDLWPWWVKGAIIVGAGVAVGMAGLYVYQFLPSPPPRKNRRRRQVASGNATMKAAEDVRPGDRIWIDGVLERVTGARRIDGDVEIKVGRRRFSYPRDIELEVKAA